MRQSKSALQNLLFPRINYDDALIDSGAPVERKITKIMQNLANVQKQCTIVRMDIESSEKQHPWTRGRKYMALRSKRQTAQKIYRELKTVDNKNLLKQANIDLFAEYKKQKQLYFNRLVQNSSGNSREIYTLMKEKRKPTQKLPIRMTLQGRNYYGANRGEKIAEYLESCFAQSTIAFSNDFDELDMQIGDIY